MPTDKERLDWLESKSDGSAWIACESGSGCGFKIHNAAGFKLEYEYARPTARAAIDAAMEREKQTP